jgi:hypothetical protein
MVYFTQQSGEFAQAVFAENYSRLTEVQFIEVLHLFSDSIRPCGHIIAGTANVATHDVSLSIQLG